jgi:hypothetical protein
MGYYLEICAFVNANFAHIYDVIAKLSIPNPAAADEGFHYFIFLDFDLMRNLRVSNPSDEP